MNISRICFLSACFIFIILVSIAQAEECPVCSNRTLTPTPHNTSSAPGYCESHGGSHLYEYIQSVTYTVNPSGTITITVDIYIANPTGCTYGKPCPEYDASPEYINAWIDWDGDKVFEPEERVMDAALTGYANINYHGTMTASTIVTIPENAVSETWMRVNLGWGHDPNDPCEYSWTWGDVVDVKVEIAPINIVQRKLELINKLEELGLDESSSKTLLEELEKELPNENAQYKIERMIVGEEFTVIAVNEGLSLSESVGKSITATLWEGSIIPGYIELILSVCSLQEETKKILKGYLKKADDLKFKVGEMSQVEKDLITKTEDELYDKLYTYHKEPSELVEKLREFRGELEKTFAQAANDKYLNKGVEIYYVLPTNYIIKIKSSSIRENVDKLNTLIKADKIEGSTEEARAKAESYGSLIESTKDGVKTISDSIYYLVNLNFIDDATKFLANKVAANDVSTIIKYGVSEYGIPALLEKLGKDVKHLGKKIYFITVGGNAISAEIGYGGLGLMTFEHKFGVVHIAQPEDLPSIWLVIMDPPGSNLKISGSISELNESIEDFIVVLDELNMAVKSKNVTEIRAKLDKYINTSVKTSHNLTDTFLEFENLTSICSSFEEYQRIRSNFINASVDFDINSMLIDSYLIAYFEGGQNETVLEELEKQINKTKESCQLLKENLSSVENIIAFWIPTIEKTLRASEIGSDKQIPIAFTIHNIGLSTLTNVSVRLILPENVTAEKSYWNIGNLSGGKNVTISTYITITEKIEKDYIIKIIVGDEEGHNATGIIYVNILPAFSGSLTTISDYGLDTDGDSLYNYLRINAEINVTSAGNAIVKGYLYDSNGSVISEAENSTYLDTGEHTIILNFDGFTIFKHKTNGPYLVNLKLEDKEGNLLDEKNFTTSAYNYTDFQHLVALTGYYSDYGRDVDNDGIYDYLTIDVGVFMAKPGHCFIKARLIDVNGEEIVWAENTTWLEAGEQIIQLHFNGSAIYEHGVNGPYYLRDVYVYHTGDPAQSDYVYEAYTTKAYSYLEFGENLPPTANANGPYTGIEGQPVEFNASASYDPEGMPLTYYWEFGDGNKTVTTQPTITHIYAQEGNYTVTLIVNDSVQNSTPSITYALINDTEPKANFTANVTSGFAPLTVQFNDSSVSYDGIIAWEWDFNGDGIIDSNEQNPTYTYDEAGTYTVSLTVYEADGDSDTETKTDYITVTSAVDTEPPTIESVTLDTYINIPNSSFHVTVEATDNVGVTSVTADGVALTKTGSTWEGDIFIPEGTPEGEYTLTITAQDEAGNTAESSVNYTVVFPQGGFAVAIDPMMSSASGGDVKVYQIKIISNENFDDKIHVYISDEGIPDAYKANFSFNWTDKTIYLKSGETVELSLEVTIPQASGYKMFRVYADSMRFRTSGYCTGIVLIS